jgi:hypothetical protein
MQFSLKKDKLLLNPAPQFPQNLFVHLQPLQITRAILSFWLKTNTSTIFDKYRNQNNKLL